MPGLGSLLDAGSAGSVATLPQVAALLGPFAPVAGEVGVVNQAWPVLDVRRYGGLLNGVHDDATAIRNALLSAKAQPTNKCVYLAGVALVGSGFALDNSYSNVTIRGDGYGASQIIKAFDGDLFTLTSVLRFAARNFSIDGQYGTHVGRGFVMTGNCNYPDFDVEIFGMSGDHIVMGPDCGYNGRFHTRHFTGPGQPDFVGIHVAGPDTTATARILLGCVGNGHHKFEGATDTLITGCFATRYEFDAASSIATVIGSVWANNGVPMTIAGANVTVMGCRMSGDVTLDASLTGAFIGNVQTGGVFTDNTVPGNCLVWHHPLATDYNLFARQTMAVNLTGGNVPIHASNDVPDADLAWAFGNASTIVWSSNLTQNRVMTFAVVGVQFGTEVLVSRPGGDVGGPWHVTLGGFGVLLTKQWVRAQWNGGFWRVIESGVLP